MKNQKKQIVEITKRILSLDEGDATKALRRIVIKRENDPENPRTEWENTFKIYSNCRYLASDKGAENPVVDYGNSPDKAKFKDGLFALSIYAYVHSGMALSLSPFNDPWDSGCAGFMYVDKEEFCKAYGLKRFSPRRARRVAEGEIATLQQYIDGEVFGFVEQTRESVEDEWVDGESVWGFYGEDYIGDMCADASGYEKGTIICVDDGLRLYKDEVTMSVLKEYYNRVNEKECA